MSSDIYKLLEKKEPTNADMIETLDSVMKKLTDAVGFLRATMHGQKITSIIIELKDKKKYLNPEKKAEKSMLGYLKRTAKYLKLVGF